MSPLDTVTGQAPTILEDDSSSASSTGTIMPTNTQHVSTGQSTWQEYFEQELFLEDSSITYHVYLTAPKNPSKDPLFVCHHGAGSSGLSFALFARDVKRRIPGAGVLSADARGHGLTASRDAAVEHDFSLPTLTTDFVQMILKTRAQLDWSTLPNLCFVGHSLGGAVVTQVAKDATFGAKLVGFCVIDLVEGSAIDALRSMPSYLANRPTSFNSVESAVEWHTRSRTVRNPESAAMSTPSLLRQVGSGRWVWKTDLYATKPYWEQWYTGMSKNFLAGKAAKLLLLAGTDRLDKELMIGQMQGKFQLQVFPEAGHFVQEDLPDQTAEVVAEFFKRNDRSTLVLPPKVGDLIAQGKKV